MHFSHVGANTGRDHFSGWSLDWINLALGYLPFLHRFYAPADARAAFIAVRDAAAHYGGHIVAIPRDTLPVLTKQGSSDPLWQADEPWSAVTQMRSQPNAKTGDSRARRAGLPGGVGQRKGDGRRRADRRLRRQRIPARRRISSPAWPRATRAC